MTPAIGPGTAGLIRHAVRETISQVEERALSQKQNQYAGRSLEDGQRERFLDELVDEVKRLLLVEEGIGWQD